MSAALIIRPMIADDRVSLRQAIIELQDYERLRHTSRLPGAQIADAYLDWMLRQAEAGGAVLLAEIGGAFAGFVAGWIKETDNLAETADSNRFGYISDICVMPAFRGQRIAVQLLDAIERYLRPAGIVRLRISALAVNRSAWTSYEAAGFVPYEILYDKDHRRGRDDMIEPLPVTAHQQAGTLVNVPQSIVPALVVAAGDRAGLRFLEFFASNIRNPHTRRAYNRAVTDFLLWCEEAGVPSITAVQSLHVGTWIELQTRKYSAPTVKQHLAAIRHLFDWLVTGQVVPANPAASVRGPSHSVRRGKTPVLAPDEARALLNSIDVTKPAGLRDRALIGLMVYSFARIGAALGMKVEDVYTQNRRLWVRLHEKGGKRHDMPCHHNLEAWLHDYIDQTGIAADPKGPLFRTIGSGTGKLTATPLPQQNAHAMIRRRTAAAGIATKIGNHSFRATGITAYLKNGGTLEKAANMANHASTRTTQLYDRRPDDISLDEVERIGV